MIINTEIKDYTRNGTPVLDEYGRCKRFLCVSYVNDEGIIEYYTHLIPTDWMYQWKYATRSDTPDSLYKSWDFKDVVKEPICGNFSEERLHEMILDLQRLYPDDHKLQMFDKLNIPKTIYVDIEVDVQDDGFVEAKDATNRINTAQILVGNDIYVLGLANLSQNELDWIHNNVVEHCERFDTDYVFHYKYYETEESMLNDLIFGFFKDAQCVTGWNFFGYDWPYIYNRVKKCYPAIYNRMKMKGELSPTGTWTKYKPQNAKSKDEEIFLPMHKAMYDYLEIYKKWDRVISPKESNKLDWVAEKCLGVKKVVHQLGFKDMWEQQKKEYVFYGAIDSILVREIDKKLRTSAAFFGLGNIMHTPALTAFSSTRSLQIVQSEYLYQENRVFPTKRKDPGEKKEYEGAFVYEPVPGTYRNTICCDYASLYPTTIRQFNISPDTLLFKDKNYVPKENEIKCTNGCVYTKDFQGFLPKILTDFYGKRKAYKKEMVIAQKEKYELQEILERRKAALKK